MTSDMIRALPGHRGGACHRAPSARRPSWAPGSSSTGSASKPCPLCLEQRYAYYFAIPLAVMVVLGDQVGASRKVLMAALVAIALGMLWNAGLGVYHAGVEWSFWVALQECSGALDDLGSAGGLLNKLQSITVVRCDEAAWRFLGLSLAGYNVIISLALAAIAAWA